MALDEFVDYSALGLDYDRLVALAWLKHQNDHVQKKGFSLMASYDGRHRAGKSVLAAEHGYLWDATFWPDFENRIVSDYKDFANLMEQLDHRRVNGPVIMVDEAGVSMSSADWYEGWMKSLTKVFQMFGYLHPRVLFVAPVKDFVDSRLRRMFHLYVKVNRYNTEECIFTPYDVLYNTLKNKFYYRKPTVRIGGQEVQIRRIRSREPPREFLKRYQNFELRKKPEMLKEFIDGMRKQEIQQQKQEVDLDKVVDFVAKNYKLYEGKRSKQDKITLDVNKIEFGWKVPNRQAQYIKGKAEETIEFERKKVMKEIEEKKG